jgi:hypothetical protein
MLLNQIYKYSNSDKKIRIIFDGIEYAYIIDIESLTAWPETISKDDFEFLLKNNEIEQIDEVYIYAESHPNSLKKRDENYELLLPLIEQKELLFDKRSKNKIIAELSKETGKPKLFYNRILRRYWQRGLKPNALLPEYHLCGGKGKARRDIQNKLGKKREQTEGDGIIVTDAVADVFKYAIEGFYIPNNKTSIQDAYTKMLSLYKSEFVVKDYYDVPTYSQFYYFYEANYNRKEVEEARLPSKIYDKDIRPLMSTATNLNFGPGARYEIDATIGDIYLVSNKDPDKIIGRPVIYLVKDVFSRMVVGLYVGLENPSWVAAMIAMSNAFLDKVSYCKEYDIDISSLDWPSVGLPNSIMADKGELISRQADALVNVFNIQLSNSRSYRGDDKGVVERHFNTLQAKFRPFAGGIVEPVNGKKRLGKDYRLDAELSLHAFTKMIIHIVLHYNKEHVVKGYDFSPDMPEELVANPMELWNWGIKNRTGLLRAYDPDYVKINLLPTDNGTVSEEGIGFKGLKYNCQEALKLGWFERYSQVRPKSIEIAFDPRCLDEVYLRPSDNHSKYWVCKISDRSRRYKGRSYAEVQLLLRGFRKAQAKAKQKQSYKSTDLQETIESIAEEERKKKTGKITKTKSEKISSIRKNRSVEKSEERSRTKLNVAGNTDKKPVGEVVDIKSKNTKSDNLEYPDLDNFLEDDDE